MGLFDSIKSRISGRGQEEYIDDDGYYDDQEYYEVEQGEVIADERYYGEEEYYDDAPGDTATTGSRRSSAFSTFTPLVSMSDVRSQELPRYEPSATSTARSRQQTSSSIRSSLPYVSGSAEARESSVDDPSRYNTGQLGAVRQDTAVYASGDSSDPLLKRHSLSSTGDFSTTSPAYYASRSGVGHVRPAGQARRTHKFREAIVVNPASYAEAESVATNLRRENAVVLVLTQVRPELAKRILDFSFGAAAALGAQVESIGERIYALTRDHALTDAEMELLKSRGVI